MERIHGLDANDLNILQILSLDEHMNLMQLWYALDKDNPMTKPVNTKEVVTRLRVLNLDGRSNALLKGNAACVEPLRRIN
ncbi:MAG: hypothetical protein GTN74_14475 [Proteobacteria bacterium]|nr:hypothetical protein [Pseudomonadota bacterium]NIS71737.1 hypothetical protein [Pseudomonadota bacterium]